MSHSRLLQSRTRRAAAAALSIALGAALHAGPPRLADESDRVAFRRWFTLLADLQFEQRAPEVVDCAALVRFAYREALRPHTTEWARRIGLPATTPVFADVRSGPKPGPDFWPLFQVSDAGHARFAEFADAQTIVRLNARPLGRDVDAARPGDLLYFHQPEQREPDHLMVFVGPSAFDPDARDWVVYHTGPSAPAPGAPEGAPGEVRKVRLADLMRHPSPRWRPVAANPRFIGVFRLSLL